MKVKYKKHLRYEKLKYPVPKDVIHARRCKIIPHLPCKVYIRKLLEAKNEDGTPYRFQNPIPYGIWVFPREDLRRQILECYSGNDEYVGISFNPTAMIKLLNSKQCLKEEHWKFLDGTRKTSTVDRLKNDIYTPGGDDRFFRGWRTLVAEMDNKMFLLEELIPCWLRETCRINFFPEYINNQLPEELKLFKTPAAQAQLQIQAQVQNEHGVIPYIISIRASQEQLMILKWQLLERISQLMQPEANALYEIAGTLIQQRELLNANISIQQQQPQIHASPQVIQFQIKNGV